VRGEGNRKGRIENGENGLCGEGESERQNRGMAEHGMTAYPLLP
jgi:hypothetical protein